MRLRTLVTLQFVYAAMALTYLAASYLQIRSGGVPLSKAPPGPAAVLFIVYTACLLFLGVDYKRVAYRIAMAIAIPVFAFSGVLMNVVSYLHGGLDGFSSFGAWAIGVAINAYGLAWNVFAALGAYEE